MNWVGILYPDDPTHDAAIQALKGSDLRWAAILHDKDIWTITDEADNPNHKAGELKKPHWHIVVTFPSQRTINPVAKALGVAPNYIESTDCREKALRYLIHLDDPDKFQYEQDEVFGPLASSIPCGEKQSEADLVLQLLDLLDSLPVPTSYAGFIRAACNANLYSALRRMGTGSVRLLDDHNNGDRNFDPVSCSYETSRTRANFAHFVEGYEAGRKDRNEKDI